MKNILLIFSLIYFVFDSTVLHGQKANLVASCCEGKTGRCTGSAYCTACKNCRYCKYCSNGGSCGVCSGGSKRTYKPKPTYTYPSTSTSTTNSYWYNKGNAKSNIYNLSNDIFSKYYLKNLMVNTLTLNLRTGPGTEYNVLKRINKYQKLIFLAMTGNWVKVKVKSTNIIGFVHYKYIVVLNE